MIVCKIILIGYGYFLSSSAVFVFSCKHLNCLAVLALAFAFVMAPKANVYFLIAPYP